MDNSISVLLRCSEDADFPQALISFLHQKELLSQNSSTENNPDLHFMNSPEENISIEVVRQLNQDVLLRPYNSAKSIFVIYNIDQGSIAAQNALLKLIEEPPEYVQILLTTCALANVLQTIQSRCQIEDLIEEGKGVTSTPSASSKENFSEIYDQLKKASLSDVITLSEKYKERPDALQFVHGLLDWLHQLTPSADTTHQLNRLAQTEELLRKNAHVRLAFEDCFFQF